MERVLDAERLSDGDMRVVRVANHDLIVARVDGVLYAIEDRCSHEDVPLSDGCLVGATIKCSLHGSHFCLR